MRVRMGGGVVMLALLGAPGFIQAQGNGRADSTTVVPGPHYRAGGLTRTLFGKDYRPLWTTPIRVPTLDLQRFAGGIHPTEEGGGEQTRSLRFKNSAGREFQFRSVDKDAAGALPEELRETFIAGIVRDQASSGHPAAALIVAPLLEAAGLLHAPPVLVRMPNDTLLGQFREKFAGMLGTIEERPDSGFAGSTDVEGTEDLFERLNKDPEVRVHRTEYLAARLIDFLVGDWDRHRDQWRWARVDSLWRPIPRDRDAAFTRYDGWFVSLARLVVPKLQNYDREIPSLGGLTRNGIDLDRRLLAGVERASFDSVAAALQECLTDSVLAEAVRSMPAEFSADHKTWILTAMKGRRGELKEAAERFYLRLAQVVELTATDQPETATIERESGGSTLVTVTYGENTLFRRRFDPSETREIRVRLRGGDDQVRISREEGSRNDPLVRVIGGEGNDRYEVQSGSGIRLYDDKGDDQVTGDVHLDRKPWRWDVDTIWVTRKPPDVDIRQRALPTMGIARDVGVVFGLAGWIDWHRFRHAPYATRLSYSAVYSTTRGSGRITGELRRQLENSAVFYGLEALGSGIESLRWYGFGNETVEEGPAVFYRLRHDEVQGRGFVGFRFGSGEATVGPLFRWASTPLESGFNVTRFIAEDRPYGTGSFMMAGGAARVVIDTRDVPGFARKGFRLSVSGEAFPRWLDTDSAVARIEGQASIAFAPFEIARRRPSLHLMAGGIKTWGGLPYFLAATLGGQQRLRGYSADRFAGDAAVYGSAEIRLPLTRFKLLLPGEQGLFGFIDAGRVSVRNRASDTWHHAEGVGIWFSFLEARHVVSLALARPDRRSEGSRLVVSFGFPY